MVFVTIGLEKNSFGDYGDKCRIIVNECQRESLVIR